MLNIFINDLLPVFLAAGCGFWLRARSHVDPKPLTQVGFYVLAPCLIFRIITANRITGFHFLATLGFAALVLLLLAGAAFLIARRQGWPRALTAGVVLTVLLPNAGNFGLSANLFAFGEDGLREASLYFVSSSILTYTAGVFIASMGRLSPLDAMGNLLRVPALWAVPAGFLMARFRIDLPLPLDRTVNLLADACIPVFLLILGMQLSGARWKGRVAPMCAATALRLGGGAALAAGAALLFGVEGVARSSLIFQSAMPTAVITIILATEYDVEPEFVTSVVVVTTLLCPFTLTPLLAWLKG